MRRFAKFLVSMCVALGLGLPALAQTPSYLPVTGSGIKDFGGLPLANGTICFVATDTLDNPLQGVNVGGAGQSFNRGSGNCGTIVNGVITGPVAGTGTFQIANPAASTPAGFLYRITVTDTDAGENVQQYKTVGISGTAFSYDAFVASPTAYTCTSCSWNAAATVSVGTVTAGSAPSVTNSGNSSQAVLNFILPSVAAIPGATITGSGPSQVVSIPGSVNPGKINGVVQVDGVVHTTIQSALNACTSACTVDSRGHSETISSTITLPAFPVTILLGPFDYHSGSTPSFVINSYVSSGSSITGSGATGAEQPNFGNGTTIGRVRVLTGTGQTIGGLQIRDLNINAGDTSLTGTYPSEACLELDGGHDSTFENVTATNCMVGIWAYTSQTTSANEGTQFNTFTHIRTGNVAQGMYLDGNNSSTNSSDFTMNTLVDFAVNCTSNSYACVELHSADDNVLLGKWDVWQNGSNTSCLQFDAPTVGGVVGGISNYIQTLHLNSASESCGVNALGGSTTTLSSYGNEIVHYVQQEGQPAPTIATNAQLGWHGFTGYATGSLNLPVNHGLVFPFPGGSSGLYACANNILSLGNGTSCDATGNLQLNTINASNVAANNLAVTVTSNGTVTNPINPTVTTNTNAVGNGYYAMGAVPGVYVNNFKSGGRDSYIDETWQEIFDSTLNSMTLGARYGHHGVLLCYAPGDCQNEILAALSSGVHPEQSEGSTALRLRTGELFTVQQGTPSSIPTCTSTCTWSLTQTQGATNGWASGLPLIELPGYNTGYIASVDGTGFTFTGSSTAGWDSTFGLTNATAVLTANVDNAYNGAASTTNTFPFTNEVLPVSSTSGFTLTSVSGHPLCIFSAADMKWQVSNLTAIGSGTLTTDQMDYPMTTGSVLSQGGLCGYGFGMDANTVGGSVGMQGFGYADDGSLSNTLRQVWPIMQNTAGNVLTVYNLGGVRNPAGNAPLAMGGSGGSATVTLGSGPTAGQVVSCTATGGTGYLWGRAGEEAPQLVISGLTGYTAPPVIQVASETSGALSTCAVLSAGSGITGTPTVAVVTSNPYHIYAQAQVLDAENHATTGAHAGLNDGSAIVTMPYVGTASGATHWSTSNTAELAHYFAFRAWPINTMEFQAQSSWARPMRSQTTGGQFNGYDYEDDLVNLNSPLKYLGLPGNIQQNGVYGNGTAFAPSGTILTGTHANAIYTTNPPTAGQFGDHTATVFVDCQYWMITCANWNAYYNVLGVRNANTFYGGNAYDADMYDPVTMCWLRTAGATQFNVFGAPTGYPASYTFCPNGFTSNQPIYATSTMPAANTSTTQVPSMAWVQSLFGASSGPGFNVNQTAAQPIQIGATANTANYITLTNIGGYSAVLYSQYNSALGPGHWVNNATVMDVLSNVLFFHCANSTTPGVALSCTYMYTHDVNTSNLAAGYAYGLNYPNLTASNYNTTYPSCGSPCNILADGQSATIQSGMVWDFTAANIKVPTQTAGNNTTYAASTAFVTAAIATAVSTAMSGAYTANQATAQPLQLGSTASTSNYIFHTTVNSAPAVVFFANTSANNWRVSAYIIDSSGNVLFDACANATTATASAITGCTYMYTFDVNAYNLSHGYAYGLNFPNLTGNNYNATYPYCGLLCNILADGASATIQAGMVWDFTAASLKVPTQTAGNNTTYAASTAFVTAIQGRTIGTAITSASTISPLSPIVHITGTTAIGTITAPTGCTTAGTGCEVTLIPDGLWTTTTGGNIAIASTAVVSKAMIMVYDPSTTKWYPSY